MRIKHKTYHKRFAVLPIQCRKCYDTLWLEKYIMVDSILCGKREYCEECASKKFSDYPYKKDSEVTP